MDGTSPDSQSNTPSAFGPETVTFSGSPDNFGSDALLQNQHTLGTGTFVDVLADAPALSALDTDRAAGAVESIIEAPSISNKIESATGDTPTNDGESNSETQRDPIDAAVMRELVFVDANVTDYERLIDDLQGRNDSRTIEVVVLESDRDGIGQVTEILSERSNLAAVHFITHGTDGQINLGNSLLNSSTLEENNDAVAGWGNALTETGDILFYGCDFASNTKGQTLVESLANLTGADVAASNDDTGHAIFNADWDLEYKAGEIETAVAFSRDLQDNWGHLLNVAVDATSTGTSTGGDFSVLHTTSGTDRLMLVGVSMNLGGSQTVNSVTYNGDSLSLVGVEEAGDARIEIWALLAPDVGTFNVDIAFSSPTDGNTAGVMTFTGVDQSTPLGAFASDFGYGESTASTTVSSAADELVFGVVSIDDPNFRVLTEGAGQTERWELDGFQTTGGGSTAPGAESVNMSWTWPASDNWAAGGVSIKPSAANAAPVITSNGGGDAASIYVAENTTAVTTITVNDPDGGTPVYTLISGADQSKFAINSSSGELTFQSAPDFENPTDADTDNVYEVVVLVSDGNGGTDTQAISVTVTDVLELVVTNTNATGTGSLHEAILNANANVGVTDTITFNVGGGGPQTILVDPAGLPLITDSVILDATTQPGYSGTPLITLDGSATPASSGINGITLRANNSTVKGFIVINFADEGIEMDGSTGFGDNNIIQNNWVGIDAAGNAVGNAEHGIMISDNATGNQIGGTGPNEGNVTAGNGLSGIIINENSDNNIVEGNIIGIKPDGTTPAGNGTHGILIQLASDGNRIGGTTAGAGNIVAGNTQDGIFIDGTTDATYTTIPTGTVIQGNWIGTTGNGSTGVGNGNTGINVEGANTIIGGTGVNDGNVITNNDNEGINVAGTGATGTFIQGNIIGLDPDGSTKSGNGDVGIALLSGADDTTIGGTTAAARNVISNNVEGIEINSNNNVIQGNYIGTDAGGSLNCGNHSDDGVEIKNGATGNLIGGEVAGAGNIIAFNALNGVNVVNGSNNAIVRNSIHSNTLLGINLGTAGVTVNDVGDGDGGANNLQNFPVLTSAETNGSQITITGTLNSLASTSFRIEFYSNSTADGTGYGEGQTLIGVHDVTTDGFGNASFSPIISANVAAGSAISATVSRLDIGDAEIETSEFAQNVIATAADNTLWISADEDSLPPDPNAGADGLPGGWKEGEVLQFGGPDLTLGAATDGDFSSVIDFDLFTDTLTTGSTDPGALHFVSRALTIGSGANQFSLQIGDVLVSFNQDETIIAAYYETGADTTVHMNDLLAFRPDTPGDYTSGTFYMLLNGMPDPLGAPINSLHAISLVEQDTYVGSTLLPAGSFIFSEQAGVAPNTPNHIYHFTATDAGQAAAAGTSQILIDGNDINIEVGSNIRGLDLIEKPITIGGMTFDSGDILVTLSIDDVAVGNAPTLNTSTSDIFVLKVTQSEPEPGNFTAATAEMVLDGSQVNFDGTERVYAISVVPDNYGPAVGGDSTGTVTEDVGVVAGNISDSGTLTVADPDAGESSFVPETIVGTLGSLTIDAAGAWTYTADNSQAAIQSLGASDILYDVFTIITADGTTQRVTITINGANDAPTTSPVTLAAIGEDSGARTITQAELLSNANDIEGDGLAATGLVISAGGGVLVDNGDGTWDYTPAADDDTSVSFTYTITDGTDTVGGSATLDIIPVNDVPVATANTVSTTEDVAYSFASTDFTFTDAEGDSLVSATISNLNLAGGTLTHSGGVAVNSGDTLTAAELDTLVYTPAGNATGTPLATFDFTVNDAGAGVVAAQMGINVTAVNDVPVATANTVSTTEDVAYSFASTDFTFTDAEGDSLVSATISNLNLAGGTLTHSGGVAVNSGDTLTAAELDTLVYTPAGNATGTPLATFDFTVNDAGAGVVAAQMGINVTAVNDVPVATANTVSTTEDVAYSFASTDFTFTDAEGDSLVSATISNLNLAGGTLTHSGGVAVNSGDTLTAAELDTLVYTPAGNATGTPLATFDFTVNDAGAGVVAAQMGINVTAVNDVPVATANTVSTTEDVAYSFASTDFTFTDAEGDSLVSATISNLNLAGGTLTHSGGVAVNSGDTLTAAELDTLVYTPAGNATGTPLATFDFTVNDAGAGVVAAQMGINVTAVNDVPVATANTVSTTEDVAYSFASTDFTFTDAEGDSLVSATISNLNLAGGTLTHSGGVAVNSGDTLTAAELDTLVYTPAGNATGTPLATFDFTVNDAGAGVVAAQMGINVTAVNDVPVATANTVSTTEDVAYSFASTDFTFTDAEGDSLVSATISNLNLAGGTLTHSGGVAVNSGDTLTAAELDTLVYTPAGNATGTPLATFDFTVNDAGAGVVAAQMGINVTAVNDVPVATANTVSTTEDVAYSFASTDFTFTDAEGDSLVSATISNLNLAGGTLTHSGGVAVNSGDTLTAAELDTLVYTPAGNATGTPLATFDFTVNDAGAGVVAAQMGINVTAVNDVPVATANTVSTTEDVAYSFASTDFTFTDAEGDSLVSATISNLNLAGGTLTHSGGVAVNSGDTLTAAELDTLVYTPAGNATGTPLATFDFTVNDAGAGVVAAQMGINVTAVNDVPVATANTVSTTEDVAYSFASTDFTFTDAEGDSLVSATISNLNLAGGTLTHSGGVAVNSGDTLTAAELDTLVYTPAGNATGTPLATFDFTVNDAGAGVVAAQMGINVTAVNDVPVATANTVSTTEDVAYSFASTDFTFTDAEGDSLVSATISNLNLAGGTLTHSGGVAVNSGDTLTAAELDTLVYTPAGNATGTPLATFDFTVNDAGAGVVAAQMGINVTAVNDVPTVANPIPDQVATEDTPFTFTFAANTFADLDVGDTLTYISDASGWLSFNAATRTFSGTPLNADVGTVTVTVTADDGNGGTVSDTFDIVVGNTNDAPTGSVIIDNMTPAEGDTLTAINTLVDADGLSGPIGYQWYLDGIAIGGATGVTYTTVPADVGGVITVVAGYTDDQGTFESVSSAPTAAVTHVNHVPVIGGVNAAAVTEDMDPDTDGQLEVSGALTISDPDAGESSFQAGTIVGGYGRLTIDAVGNWTYAADNTQAAIQQLDAAESVTDMLTVTTADGTTHTITITIDGAEDTPVINDSPGPVDEGGGDPGPDDEVDPIEDDPEPDEEPSIDDELPTAEDVAVPNQRKAGAPGTIQSHLTRPRNSVSTIQFATPEYVYQTDDESGSIANRLLNLLEKESASPSEGMIAPIATVFFSPDVMAQVLDHLQKQIDDTVVLEAHQGKLIVGAAAGFGASVLVGYVVWAFRGTSLLLGALSAMPMWRCFDPLPVLIGNDKKRNRDGEENLGEQELVEEKRVRDLLDSD